MLPCPKDFVALPDNDSWSSEDFSGPVTERYGTRDFLNVTLENNETGRSRYPCPSPACVEQHQLGGFGPACCKFTLSSWSVYQRLLAREFMGFSYCDCELDFLDVK